MKQTENKLIDWIYPKLWSEQLQPHEQSNSVASFVFRSSKVISHLERDLSLGYVWRSSQAAQLNTRCLPFVDFVLLSLTSAGSYADCWMTPHRHRREQSNVCGPIEIRFTWIICRSVDDWKRETCYKSRMRRSEWESSILYNPCWTLNRDKGINGRWNNQTNSNANGCARKL